MLRITLRRFSRILFTLALVGWFVNYGTAQKNKKALDMAAIRSMAGCYNVEFKYTETFAPEVDYEQAYDYTSAAFEWAGIIEESDNKIVLQHLLIINDSTIIKHWRQDWIYEADGQYVYDKDQFWKYQKFDKNTSKGKWTQEVYQVDDSPRYSGTATWVHFDNRHFWENTADSPLPRREHSKRSDYNVMKRGNHVEILQTGWVHEQDNDKVIRKDGEKDVLLVQEKGFNHYSKRKDDDCKPAIVWWEANKDTWLKVQAKWSDVLGEKENLKLNAKVDNKSLFEHFYLFEKKPSNAEITELIDQFIVK